uniref:Laminin EGF-like domain-containing protein n=1 Tax=Petromyzon marinus TaxID=7757 RepID=S4RN02_PETMA
CCRCASGYYGSPGAGEQCRPCQCPEGPGTGRHFASGCSHDPRSRAVACACLPGFTGARCDQCSPGHYGDLRVAGGRCQPCQCNGNIDPTDAASCDGRTGRCLRCLRDTEGSACQNCRPGYYGDATSQRRCQKCTCVTAGTERSSCGLADGACACDPRSGQCRCLPNVQGLACDRCTPNHWGLSQGTGCRPCGCDPAHSAGPSCSEFNGQCHCLPGFGGLTCSECQENHWGEPRVKCSECLTHNLCMAQLAYCLFRPPVRSETGRRCDRCARGFSGAFPACEPCHEPCFPDWEAAISELGRRAGGLSERATRLLTGGADAGPYARRMAEVEENLAGARELLAVRNASAAAVERLSGLIDDVGRQVEAMTGRLAQLEAGIGGAAKQNGDANVLLSELDRDAREASTRASELGYQIDTIKHSNFRGAYGSVKDSYQQSREAERKASGAATNPAGPVARSEATRQRAEKFMAAKRAELEQRLDANADALQELGWEARQLELNELNEKVCGVTRDVPCAESACGGVGCRDEDGRPHCGGMNCGGVATVASNALERSTIADREIQKALGDLDKLHQQVMDVKSKAGKAKEEAQGTLQRANGTRAQVEGAVQGLRELIKQIKEFLTGPTEEGASPDSIELVAERVLRLGVPASPQQIGRLADEIKERVSSLANVDAILARTAGSINEAERLLQDAKRAKARAENAKSAAETVRKALAGAREAQAGAEVAIQQARSDLHDTQDTLASTESETAAAGQRLQDATARLLSLERDVDALKMKTAANSLAAGKADKAAGMAKQRADEAKQMHYWELRDRFRALQDLLYSNFAVGVAAPNTKSDVTKSTRRRLRVAVVSRPHVFAELEVAYDGNAVELERKAHRLRGLEDKLRGIVYAINKQINVYNTCQ